MLRHQPPCKPLSVLISTLPSLSRAGPTVLMNATPLLISNSHVPFHLVSLSSVVGEHMSHLPRDNVVITSTTPPSLSPNPTTPDITILASDIVVARGPQWAGPRRLAAGPPRRSPNYRISPPGRHLGASGRSVFTTHGMYLNKHMEHNTNVLLTRALVGGGGAIFSPPSSFFAISRILMRRSSRNFQYPLVHQFYAWCQKENIVSMIGWLLMTSE